jgi:tight adherence protein B
MQPGLLIPVLLLLAVLVAAIVALVADTRGKRLLQRVDAVVPPSVAARFGAGRSGLLRAGRLMDTGAPGMLTRFFRVPSETPAAHLIPPRVVWGIGAVVAVGTTALAYQYQGVAVSVLGGLFDGAMLVRTVFGWESRRYAKRLTRQLPDAIELVVSATRAGLPISESLRAIAGEMPAPTGGEFARVVNEMSLGMPPDEALLALHRRTRVSEYAIFAVTIGVQMKSGGRLAETIQTLAETVRQRLAMGARAHALASEARTSAVILTSLPFVGGVMLSAIRPGYLDPLFHDPRGNRLLLIAAGGVVAGMWAMSQMISRATRE